MTRRQLPPLSALRAFEAFARTGRMTRAADELCVTHGAVSRQLRLLQDWVAAPLIEGPRSGLRLTPAGTRLAQTLTQAFGDIAAALPAADAGQKLLRVSCLGTFAMRWLIPRLPGFYNLHPGIAVEVSSSYAPVDFRGGYDAAIRMVSPDAHPLLKVTPFLSDHYGPVLSPSRLPPLADAATIGALPRLVSKSYPQSWREWEMRMEIVPVSPASETVFDHSFYLLAAASAGLGAAIGLQSLVEDDLASGTLVAPLGLIEMPQRYGFIQPAGDGPPHAEVFRDWLIQEGQTASARRSWPA